MNDFIPFAIFILAVAIFMVRTDHAIAELKRHRDRHHRRLRNLESSEVTDSQDEWKP